jgi:hypothetical protein
MIKLKELLAVREVLHKPVPPILYHATFNALIPRISKMGLIPHDDTVLHNFDNIDRGVYLAEDPQSAGAFVETSENEKIPEEWFDDIVIIAIDTSKLDISKFDVDPNVIPGEGECNVPFLYRGIVPPTAFQDITDYD